MSEATNTKLMDTERGGEQTQYEGVNEFGKSHAKESGQFDDSTVNEAAQHLSSEKQERGEKTAENIRYGEAISEHGFGVETTGNSGKANQDSGFGEIEDQSIEGQRSRREQGYGGEWC
ncbi:hypothetical protein BDZ45DRAFT_658860 [Acephala macrosclerotiorum]|nr:hypothetical protein BDZ45DRAFT_658860 [Acephala macrosclerotiorum]